MIALSPKCYIMEDGDTGEKKVGRKGVSHRHNLRLESFEQKLYNDEKAAFDQRTLQMKKGVMCRCVIHKNGLNSVFSKFCVAPDRISCEPLKHANGQYV